MLAMLQGQPGLQGQPVKTNCLVVGDKPAEVPITGIPVPPDSSLLARLSKLEAQVLALKESQKSTNLQVSKHASGIAELYSSIDAINETQASWGTTHSLFFCHVLCGTPNAFLQMMISLQKNLQRRR